MGHLSYKGDCVRFSLAIVLLALVVGFVGVDDAGDQAVTDDVGAGTGGSTCGTITIGDTTYPNGITESPFIYSQP